MSNNLLSVAAVAALLFAVTKKNSIGGTSVPDPATPSPVPDVPEPAPAPADIATQATEALRAIIAADGSPSIARLTEKLFRLETANFTSGLFKATNGAGQKAFTNTYPWGWPRRGTVASDYGPPVTMVDTGEGQSAQWVNYKELPVAMGYVAQFIRDYKGNAARWNSTDPARQAEYSRRLQGVATPFVDAIVAK